MTANQEQIDYWNSEAGPRWAQESAAMDARLQPLAQVAMDGLALRAGENVLDVGCGCGETTLLLAAAVGDSGKAVGLDISAPMLRVAQQRAANQTNIEFVQHDAQEWRPDITFDAVFSRFGVMFFEDPIAAFSNLRALTRPHGRLGFICWRDRDLNPWMTSPVRAVAHLLELPEPPAPRDPGPFAFGEPDYLTHVLEEAGWSSVRLTPVDTHLDLGTPDEAARFFTQIGPLSTPISELEDEHRGVVSSQLLEWLQKAAESGTVKLPASVWSVEANRP